MKRQDNKGFWQRVAGLYGPFMERSNRALYAEICRAIRSRLRPDMEVLELACGSGQLSSPLADSVRLWEATDFSESMIAAARKRAASPRLRFSVQDATALPYPTASFDAVVISNALHIMPHPERALAEIARVLRPGGLLFAPTFVHGESMGFRLRVWLMELFGFHTFNKWNAREFTDFLTAHGFSILEQRILGDSLAPLCYVAAAPARSGKEIL